MPGEDLALPVKRKVIAVFGDQDMSEQGRTGQPLADRPLRGRGLMDGPARPAAITRPADTDDSKPRRHLIEHLAVGLADHMQFAAAARSRSSRVSSRVRCAGRFGRSVRNLGVLTALATAASVQRIAVILKVCFNPIMRRKLAIADFVADELQAALDRKAVVYRSSWTVAEGQLVVATTRDQTKRRAEL
jgi:hypothetical protein